MAKLREFWRLLMWLWRHRGEKNCRQKFRRMERELAAQAAINNQPKGGRKIS